MGRRGYPIGTAIGSALLLVLLAANLAFADTRHGIATVIGTWTGTSTCVGNRPACKNEVVVYRIVAVDGKPEVVALYADKIIYGKRVPMGEFDFVYRDTDRTLVCEFHVGQTHGLIELTVSGDAMTGTLVVLPEKTLGRRISVNRVSDDKVPPPPGLDEYER